MRARAGRNERCPCGSGRKYKKCCLPRDRQESGRAETEGGSGSGPDGSTPSPAASESMICRAEAQEVGELGYLSRIRLEKEGFSISGGSYQCEDCTTLPGGL